MSDTPLVPGPLYGLRTWTVGDGERLAAPHRGTQWPAGRAWLVATCDAHPAPASDCGCGIHAWHPSRRSARRVLAGRREIPGIVEVEGAVEVYEEGFRAERGRPHALVLAPGRNARLIDRLAAVYEIPVVQVRKPDELLAWCRERRLGLDEPVVTRLLGSERALERRRRARRDALRVAAVVLVTAVLTLVGLAALTDPPGPRVLHGRTGEVHVH